ncbi:MAG: hypothetical protein P8Z40_11135 [Chloroflexota bacterium]|jgi:hypothetical protein
MSGRRRSAGAVVLRTMLFVLGSVIGVAAGMALYLAIKRRQNSSNHQKNTAYSIALRPQQAIAVPPDKPREIQLKPLPLTIQAEPTRFVRGQMGTIRVQTQAGARCSIQALYSTGRPPTGLSGDSLKADEDGRCEWAWTIGSKGTHVDVTVRATLEGSGSDAQAVLRVEIVA